jgi:hypothetical protein
MRNSTARKAVLVLAAMTTAAAVATISFASDASTTHHDAATGARAAKPAQGEVALVQAVPQASMSITIDGKAVQTGVAEGKVIGPLPLSAGSHQVEFNDGTNTISSSVDVTAGQTSDIVVHRPAAVGGTPIVSVYPSPTSAIDPGKARVLLAHTATTAPADVQVDGQIVFTNIANGEYAQADVAAGQHKVALLPAGVSGAAPILGPLTVDLKAGTLTAVYAVGNPKDHSMNVIVRTTELATSGANPPSQIDTGSAGLVSHVKVYTFHTH